MNGQLKTSLVNPWLASAVSFALITLFFTSAFLIMSHPLPTTKHLASMPWWAVLVAVWSEQSRSMQALLWSRRGHAAGQWCDTDREVLSSPTKIFV
jgi:uncharacterized membrane protein YdcZ (DUF606 family)